MMAHIATLHRTKQSTKARDSIRRSLLLPHTRLIEQELSQLGADKNDLWLPETHCLPFIIRPDEQIVGAMWGDYKLANGTSGMGSLIATNQRVLLLNKKPHVVRCSEVMYSRVNAITHETTAKKNTILLRIKNGYIAFRTINTVCASTFSNAVKASIQPAR
jgi:hypothetical protein